MEDLEEAIRCYRWACGRGAVVAPQETLNAARNWGRWALRRASWEEVEEAYLQGLTAGRALWRRQVRRADKESWLAEMQEMAPAAAYACVRAGGSSLRGAHILELGRAQLLGEALEQNRRDLDRLPALGHADLHERYQAVRRERQRLEAPDAVVAGDRFAAIEANDRAFAAVIADIRRVPGYADFLADPTREQILAAAQDGPLVYLLATAAGGLALIVHGAAANDLPGSSAASGKVAGEVEAVWLDKLNEAEVDRMLYDQEGKVGGRYLRGAAGGDHAALIATLAWALPQLGDRLAQPLAEALAARYPHGTPVTLVASSNLGLLPLHAAPVTLDGRTAPLLDFFGVRYAPSATALRRHSAADQTAAVVERPTVVGVGNPLPAPATGQWVQERVAALLPALTAIDVEQHLLPLPDDLPAPAAALFQALRRELLERWQAVLRKLETLFTLPAEEMVRTGHLYQELRLLFFFLQDVEIAPLTDQVAELVQRLPSSLESAEAEAYSVRDLVGRDHADLLFNHAATATALWERLPKATWLHLACHGRFNVRQPLDSALLLAEGTQITLRELLDPAHAAALQQVRLAFLSACQTAISDFRNAPEEVIGLPAGLLQAGIPAVIGTLWPVDDRSTALLVNRFYELALHGDRSRDLPPQPPLHALRLAQQWLREIDNAGLRDYLETHRSLAAAPATAGDRMSGMLYRDEQRRIRDAIQRGQEHERPYAAPYHWAPFAFYGMGVGWNTD